MAFQIKDALSIVAGMVNRMRASSTKITDYRIGSVARTLIEGPAVEIDELYQNMLRGLVESIPVALYQAFAFARRPAQAAAGRVTFTSPVPAVALILIPAGTIVSRADNGLTYTTATDTSIGVGQTQAIATVIAQAAGVAGNAGPGQLSVLSGGPPGVTVTNSAPIAGGQDEETDEERRARFLQYVASLSRGPVVSIEYGARQVSLLAPDGTIQERVTFARVLERHTVGDPPGFVDLYIYNSGTGASPELVDAVQRAMEGYTVDGETVIGYKAAGIVLRTYAVTLRVVNVALLLRMDAAITAEQDTAIRVAVTSYLDAVRIGEPAYVAEIIAAVMAIPGVVDCKVTSPMGDTIVSTGEKVISGTVTLAIAA